MKKGSGWNSKGASEKVRLKREKTAEENTGGLGGLGERGGVDTPIPKTEGRGKSQPKRTLGSICGVTKAARRALTLGKTEGGRVPFGKRTQQ